MAVGDPVISVGAVGNTTHLFQPAVGVVVLITSYGANAGDFSLFNGALYSGQGAYVNTVTSNKCKIFCNNTWYARASAAGVNYVGSFTGIQMQ
jgi:hypothetical protein|tara:strand:+ start:711 stop:989 length:279 start_codon:yes stop_codon:yes gene_type:complete